jgi:hypothetical protein
MVVDDIEDHFDSGSVELFHHLLELSRSRLRLRCVAEVGREKIQCHVAPVVAFLRIVLMDGH